MNNVEDVYHVTVDPAASDRTDEHFEFLAQVSESAAAKLLDGLLNDIRSLANMPQRNPVYNRPYLPAGKYRYMVSCDRYRIVYQIEEHKVLVDDIQDCRQVDAHRLLQGEEAE
ncbi:MAG: type II toxin-antitoxin system RelE/ParE family toxin [Oscillospiraceae bacterium]|nr:type II toxin-antitoxin system RelE/ParE family toxin [Oscillospiraceae bacterium]